MDIFKYIEFHYGGIYNSYNGELKNYFDQLKSALSEKDLDKTIYAVIIIHEWYESHFVTMCNNSDGFIGPSRETLISSREKIRHFKKITDEISEVGEKSSFFPKCTGTKHQQNLNHHPLIFLSHCSRDKKYGDAIQAFLTGLGVKDNQLIYTTHTRHKIPLGADIFDYLFNNINQNIFMILLWSNDYLESAPCLCELGALLVTKGDYVNIFTPEFEMDNTKYQKCPVNRNKLGIKIGGGDFRANMLELKDKIEEFLSLEKNSENKVSSLIDDFEASVR